MSEESLDYGYIKLNSIISDMNWYMATHTGSVLHHAFAAHLAKVAKALYDLEDEWFCDAAPGWADEAIRACIGPHAELETATEAARKAAKELMALIKEAENG